MGACLNRVRVPGAFALALLALGLCSATASAEPLSMTFTEARANVGVQLSDEALFAPPATAPFAAQIDPGSGSITAGVLQVPQFSTHITSPIDADVTVDFEIGEITGGFNSTTGVLTLKGTAGGTLASEGKECAVSTEPEVLTLASSGGGGAIPRPGAPFAAGLTGPGSIAGEWEDMQATPLTGNVFFCEEVEKQIEGPGGIWMAQEGDLVPPAAPQLTGTDPASPSLSGTPRIRGAAEAGSTVRLYAGTGCTGAPIASGSAAELGSPGIAVTVAEGVTASFSATATDAAGNTSGCSAPISYTHQKAGNPPPPPPPPPPSCVVPKLRGKTLMGAKAALAAANCKLGKVHKPKHMPAKKHRALVVKSSSPTQGATPADGEVDLRLGLKPRKARR